MGVAAYNRGSAAISAQIDREVKPTDPAIFAAWWSDRHVERLTARVTDLESDLARARACIARLRAYRTIDAETIQSERRMSDLLRDSVKRSHARSAYLSGHIGWLKGLLSCCGVSRDDVARYEASL